MAEKKRLIVGISGASGAGYGITLLKILNKIPDIEVHLVISKIAVLTIKHESGFSLKDIEAMAQVVYHPDNVGAAIASGSFRTLGMIIAPCSIRTLSSISTCASDTLMARAADVCLKERRTLILMVRETPFHLGHLRLMVNVAEMGGIIMPPVPALYTNPKTIEDMMNDTITRALDKFDITSPTVKRWGEHIGLGMSL